MSSATGGDLSARARVRDAAVLLFGRNGFGASVRAIAAEAEVSPALVIHHFGSKEGLRAACDDHVLRQIDAWENEAMAPGGGASAMVSALSGIERQAPLVAYLVQTLADGQGRAPELLERLIQDTQARLERGVAEGVVRASRDPAAQARYLTMAHLGLLLLHLRMEPATSARDLGRSLRALSEQITLPAFELYCEGLLHDSSMLDTYLAHTSTTDSPRRKAASQP